MQIAKHQNPLILDGWLEFNRYKWGVEPLKLRLSEEGKELPSIEAVLYLDKKGRIIQPPLNPYLPIVFYSTATDKVPRLYRQWVTVSKLLAEEFMRRGVKGSVAFPPEVPDIRQWQWSGFLGEVRYTFYIELPYDLNLADYSERKQVNKAERAGFTCEIATKGTFGEVIACLRDTEVRQGFNYKLTTKDLEMALEFLGEEAFRIYVCRAPTGEIASARIVLSFPGLRAIDWVAGTRTKFLPSGATQLLIWDALEDLAKHGAIGFDFAGANLPTVSQAKADWGGKLVPYYAIRPLNLRTIGILAAKMLLQKRRKI